MTPPFFPPAMSLSRKLAGARLNGPEAGGSNSDKGRATSIPPPHPAAASKIKAAAAPPPPPHAAASKRKAALQLPGSSQTEYAVIPRKRPPGRCDHDLMTERQKEVRPPASATLIPLCTLTPHLPRSCVDPNQPMQHRPLLSLFHKRHRAAPDASRLAVCPTSRCRSCRGGVFNARASLSTPPWTPQPRR